MTRVTFKKVLNDNAYGSESAEVTLESDELDPGLMLQEARRLVHLELGRSPSIAIRRALVTPRETANG